MSFKRVSPPIWSEVTAVFGGRFDPPHLGHREAVQGLFERPGIKQVLVIPSAAPPHKPAAASIEDRLEMVKRNFENMRHGVKIDDCELRRHQNQPHQPSFTYETLNHLRQSYSNLAFVIGTDQIPQLHSWARFPELLSLAHWIVLDRSSADGSLSTEAQRTLRDWNSSGLAKSIDPNLWLLRGAPGTKNTFLTVAPTHAPQVSSTRIREVIARTGAPPDGALLPSVSEYLMLSKLYGIRTSSK